MTDRTQGPGGVAGTVGAFNFIREIRFPTTAQLVLSFGSMVLFAGSIALPLSSFSLAPVFIIPTGTIIVPSIFGEALNTTTILRGERILDFRRLMGIELLSWAPLLVLLPLASLLGLALGSALWIDGFLMTLVLSFPIRILTIFSITNVVLWKKLIAGGIVPTLSVLGFWLGLIFHNDVTNETLTRTGIVVLLCFCLSVMGVRRVIRRVEATGSESVKDSPMSLFRDFLLHWLRSESDAIEAHLAMLGIDAEVETAITAFQGTVTGSRACIALSGFHPGPYRDLGSGGLPSALKVGLQSCVRAVALVPHSISNHEFNIITHQGVARLVRTACESYPVDLNVTTASTMVRQSVETAKASAQCFGNIVLTTLTLAPDDMEDMPLELLHSLESAARERNAIAFVVDTHNALSGPTQVSTGEVRALSEAVSLASEAALKLPQEPFRMGVASDPLQEFSLEDGVGPGGLSILVVQTGGKTVAYVTIDGNNMQTGFREKIIGRLKLIGIDDAEVMTTDTHLVTGLVRSPLGYHPVGENISHELFLEKVARTTEIAIKALEPSRVGYSSFSLKLRVLGANSFESITSFIGSVASRIGRSFLWLEIVVSLAGIAILALV